MKFSKYDGLTPAQTLSVGLCPRALKLRADGMSDRKVALINRRLREMMKDMQIPASRGTGLDQPGPALADTL